MSDTQISFKTRVKDSLIQYVGVYYTQYVCRDYLVLSDAFHRQSFYIISAEKDNFLHLTGVSTTLSAISFFDKCLNGTLTKTVICSIASSDGSCTMGFISVPKARPKTLLIGDELDHSKAKPMKVIRIKDRSDSLFGTVLEGSNEDLVSNYALLKSYIDSELDKKIRTVFNCKW